MHAAAPVGREREVARDHHRLADRRPAAEAELGRRPSPRACGRRAMSDGSSQWSASGRPVIALYWSARRISPADATGTPSSVNATAPASASSRHLGQLLAALAPRDRGHEADRHLGLASRRVLDSRAERRGVVDDRDRCSASRGSRSSRRRRRRRCRSRSSPRPRGRACAGGRAGRRTPGRARARRRRPRGARSCRALRRSRRSTPPSMRTSSVASIPSAGSSTRAPRMTTFVAAGDP